jgi:hypothetical protein
MDDFRAWFDLLLMSQFVDFTPLQIYCKVFSIDFELVFGLRTVSPHLSSNPCPTAVENPVNKSVGVAL